MIRYIDKISQKLGNFWRDESGVVSIDFLAAFPVFMLFFGMTYENGMVSARHVMLERGVDIAVRDVRIGRIPAPTAEILRARICEAALIIPNCDNRMHLEMVKLDLRNWSPPPATVKCIDRENSQRPSNSFEPGSNNELVFLRACTRFDPVLPTVGLGLAMVDGSTGDGGAYALVATSAYVVEPFN